MSYTSKLISVPLVAWALTSVFHNYRNQLVVFVDWLMIIKLEWIHIKTHWDWTSVSYAVMVTLFPFSPNGSCIFPNAHQTYNLLGSWILCGQKTTSLPSLKTCASTWILSVYVLTTHLIRQTRNPSIISDLSYPKPCTPAPSLSIDCFSEKSPGPSFELQVS